MLSSLVVAIAVAVGCVLLHYELLRLVSCAAGRLALLPRPRILMVVLGALFGHLAEVALFAIALWVLGTDAGFRIAGAAATLTFDQAVYVSVESYASLGSASVYPEGPLRLFAGVEALTGLLLVGWTTAFTYLAMTNYWSEH